MKEEYENYYQVRTHCPQCGSDQIESQTQGMIILDPASFQDTNQAKCDTCQWAGIVHDLKPQPKPEERG